MPLSPDDRTLIRRYLLGDVDEATIADVEERVVHDEAFFDAIELADDELVEEYLRGTGSPEERQALAPFVNTPERQRRLALTRELARRFGTAADATSRLQPQVIRSADARPTTAVIRRERWAGGWMGLAAAASVLISAGSAVYLGVQTRSLRGEVAVMTTREREEVQRIAENASSRPATQSFLVTPERTLRSSGGADFVLAITDRSGQVAIQFQLASEASSPRYGVVVRRVGGQQVQVWGETGLTLAAGRVVATIPSAILTPDDYQATVSTADGAVVADYRFRVTS